MHAALAGTVTYAGPLAGVGIVVVDHGATRTTYQPVSASVAVGTAVRRRRRDRHARRCPARTASPRACLHWGWIEGETYLDPLLLVGAGPVRLLPLWQDRPPPERLVHTARPVATRQSPSRGQRGPADPTLGRTALCLGEIRSA